MEGLAILVAKRHQVELTRAKVFGTEKSQRIRCSAIIDRISVRVCERCLDGFGKNWRSGHKPVASLIKGFRKIGGLIVIHKPRVGFANAALSAFLGLGVRIEGLVLLDAN